MVECSPNVQAREHAQQHPGMAMQACNPGTWRDDRKPKAVLNYIAKPRLNWAAQDPVFKKRKLE